MISKQVIVFHLPRLVLALEECQLNDHSKMPFLNYGIFGHCIFCSEAQFLQSFKSEGYPMLSRS